MTYNSSILDSFLLRVGRRLGARLRDDELARAAVSADESGLEPHMPRAVVCAKTTADVSFVAKEAAELGVGLVPRGAGTGKAGGCIPRPCDVVVDLSAMGGLLQMRPGDLYAVVQPGLITADLDAAAQAEGLMYPPDPASLESCSIGGNIATNAGGPRAVKYGVTHRYVWGLEVVVPGGDVVRMGRRAIKGVAGYDLTSLWVGSEGTLGFITEATLHLIPSPRGVATGWLSFASPAAASRAAERVFAAGILPRMLELFDEVALDAVRPKSAFAIPEGLGAALLLETDGADDDEAQEQLIRLCGVAADDAVHSAIASSLKDQEAMRRARRLVSSALKEIYPCKLSDDIAVPRSMMPALIERAQEEGANAGLTVSAYGHLGDGNLHINLLCRNEEEKVVAREVRERLIPFALQLGGTVSGEHGIGMAKREVLSLEHPRELLAMQRRIKGLFDPGGIMNPNKVFLPTDDHGDMRQ